MPIAITALNSEAIERRGPTDTLDVIRRVSNLQANNVTGLGSASV